MFRLLATALVEEYDVATAYWTPLAPLPSPQMRCAVEWGGRAWEVAPQGGQGGDAGACHRVCRFGMVPGAGQLLAFGGQPSCPVADQLSDDCAAQTLISVLGFADVVNPNVYLSIRNTTSSS